ncbi:WD repeat-containing protein 44 isoform X2 [Parasteatoda tepidariorum]|uniref:WD repeat-containing protein 44 isoform X2 n=1 Tax=Parasteatoda tepidariorum TaxID=114398 RepID=UPI0039BD1560
MSSESDSEVFFDAEESTPVRSVKAANNEDKVKEEKIRDEKICSDTAKTVGELIADDCDVTSTITLPNMTVNEEDLKEAARKAKDNEQRRKKVEEMRKLMLDDDDVLEIHSETSSLASSSVEGIYPKNNNYAFKKPDRNSNNETSSVMSLGKVGSILGERDHPNVKDLDSVSVDSKYSTNDRESLRSFSANSLLTSSKCSEPDVVASTKGEQMLQPVAPPRRKKRKNPGLIKSASNSTINSSSDLPSPTDPVESLARELEFSLDLHSATRGQYVVKPQNRYSLPEFQCILNCEVGIRQNMANGRTICKEFSRDREQDRAEGPVSNCASSQSSLKLRSDSLGSNSSKKSHNIGETSDLLKGPVEDVKQQPSLMVRTRSDSGRPLTDEEILAQVTVRNLDTGEQIPLSQAEDHLPKCLNPLSLHIMRLTSEYVSNTALDKESDDDNGENRKLDALDMGHKAWNRTRDLGKRLRHEVSKIKTVVKDKVSHARHDDDSEDEILSDQRSSVKIKVSSKLRSAEKGNSEFESIKVLQELGGEHTGAIWTMKFSSCGRLLATAGQDHDLRIWVLKDAYKYFNDMRQKYNSEGKTSPAPPQHEVIDIEIKTEEDEDNKGPFVSKPFCRYQGHTAELLDVSWSKNYFILSSSMDKTVRLWHISRKECLCCFQHIDFVTAIAFHPRDDRYFLSGSLDGKLRLWNIPDKKVTLWNELDGQTKLITAVNFCQNGKIAIVGSYDGRCIFYYTEQLKYYTQIHVRSTKGKNAQGRKISGIEAMPGEDKILVTSNDSRIRLYDLRDLCLTCKYKGYVNLSSQIKASFSHDGKYIISGSENQDIYIWKTSHDCAKFRRDRNDYWTGIKAHNAVVTSAVFAPNPALIVRQLEQEEEGSQSLEPNINNCYVMVSADFNGIIKVFLHKAKPAATNTA